MELETPGAEAALAETIAAEESSPDVQVRSAAAEGREALALRALDRKDAERRRSAELAHLLGNRRAHAAARWAWCPTLRAPGGSWPMRTGR